MKKLQVAVIGLGKLGIACATFLLDETELALAGVVRRAGSPATLPGRRQEVAAAGIHASLMLEARFDAFAFAARVMLDAAHRIPDLPHGAHRYALGM